MNNHCTVLDTATIDHEPLTVEQAEPTKQPLDFAALRPAARNLPADWDYASYMTVVDMAERCEKAEKAHEDIGGVLAEVEIERQRLAAERQGMQNHVDAWKATADSNAKMIRKSADACAQWKQLVNDAEKAVGMDSVAVEPGARSLVEQCQEIKAERNRLKEQLDKEREMSTLSISKHCHTEDELITDCKNLRAQLAQAVADRDQLLQERDLAREADGMQPSGLSEEEWRTFNDCCATLFDRGFPGLAKGLEMLVDRLSRQKVVPWIKVVDGKRPGELDDRETVVAAYQSVGSEVVYIGEGRADQWLWDRVKFVVRLSDLLATLPKGDATP